MATCESLHNVCVLWDDKYFETDISHSFFPPLKSLIGYIYLFSWFLLVFLKSSRVINYFHWTLDFLEGDINVDINISEKVLEWI